MKQSRSKSDLSLAAKLETDVALAGLSKRLATVAIDAPIGEVTVESLRHRGTDDVRLRALFAKLGFSTLQKRLAR
jgi:hypothetical protein